MNLLDLDPSALTEDQRIAIISTVITTRALEMARNFSHGECATIRSPLNETTLTLISLKGESGTGMVSLQEGDPREDLEVFARKPAVVGIFLANEEGVAFVPYGEFVEETTRPTDESIRIAVYTTNVFDEAAELANANGVMVEAA